MTANDHRAKVYVILGSHACRTGTLMLEHKRIPYSRVMVPTGLQALLSTIGFPHRTVPALVMDGRRVQTNPAISRFLDKVRPEPRLFPRDEGRRRDVEEAERWGDDVFQMTARRIVLAAALHGLDLLFDRGDDGRLGPLLWHHARARAVGTRFVGRVRFNVNERTERKLLDRLPAELDRIDAWIEAGVLNGDDLNAADFILASSIALLMYRRDLRPGIEERPAGALAERVLPEPDRLKADRVEAVAT